MKKTALALLACWMWATPNPVFAQQSSLPLIDGAMKECRTGRVTQDKTLRVAHFEKGRALGEQAVASNDRSPDAHFSLFCNLGELMRVDGELSITSVWGFRRMMKELDRTLELAPDHLDALSAKGTFLVRLPTVLGGDRGKGEKLLQYVLQKEPQAINARLSLAKSYCANGRHGEAIVLASEALDLAQAEQQDDFAPEAAKVLAQLRTNAAKAN